MRPCNLGLVKSRLVRRGLIKGRLVQRGLVKHEIVKRGLVKHEIVKHRLVKVKMRQKKLSLSKRASPVQRGVTYRCDGVIRIGVTFFFFIYLK